MCKIFFCRKIIIIDCILYPYFFFSLKRWTSETASRIPLHRTHLKIGKFRPTERLLEHDRLPQVPILEWTRNSPRPLLFTSRLKAHELLSGGWRTKNRIFNRFSLLHLEVAPGAARRGAARRSPVEISSLPELYVADVKEKYERLKNSR